MYPKTISPSGEKANKITNHSILAFLETGQRLPPFQAGPMMQALTARCIAEKHFDSITLGHIFFTEDGGLAVCPEKEIKNISASSPFSLAMAAPEERLRQMDATAGNGAAAVYRLCTLFFCLLSGKMPPDPAREGIVKRRRRLRLLADECDFFGAASPVSGSAANGQDMADSGERPAYTEALFRLLDCGLRTDPGRRFQNPAEFLEAFHTVEQAFDHAACQRFCLQGVKGALAGQVFALSKRMMLGRAADACQVVFPKHTLGVSRIHCSVELVWGNVVVTDLNSRFGTFLCGERLKAGKATSCPAGWEVWCGSGQEVVAVQPTIKSEHQ